MANLRDVRLRMRAIEQTLKVTKAMNLISTAKLRKSRKLLADTEHYFFRIQKSMFDIVSEAEDIQSEFFRKKESSLSAVVVVTSDKGLAGGYNANIFRKVTEICKEIKNPVLILIGSMGYRYFANSPLVILENFSCQSQVPTVKHAGEITDYLVSQYLWGVFDEIHIVYTHMFNTVKIQPTVLQIIPLDKEKIQKDLSNAGGVKRVDLKFEFLPSRDAVFDSLVPQYIRGMIYGCMVEAYTSEQSARMSAMEEASKSAEEMLDSLRISYNRTRQAGITQEITEITGGTSALAD